MNSALKKPSAVNPDVAKARDLVLSHGWNSTSFQIVNPGIRRWFSDKQDAVVGFMPAQKMRVVVGAPVCEKTRLFDVSRTFEKESRRQGESVCYFGAERRLEELVSDDPGYSRFLIGAQPVWEPCVWPTIVASQRSIRSQINRAKNKGVSVTEWDPKRAHNDPQLAALLADWLASKGLPPLHFMVETETLARLEYRRIFVAEVDGKIAGFTVLSPVVTRNGWLFEQFPHRPGAPNGTVELMIDTAMREIAKDGSVYATLGISPLSKRANLPPETSQLWLRIVLGWLRRHGQRFYNFDGLDAFKAKLKPMEWEPVYAVVNEESVRPKTLFAIADAFSGNAPFKMFSEALFKAAAAEIRSFRHAILSRN